ncbi:unnamed protein product [Caenorhabditis auriculariae]|uniref:Uncharacterized protein n=1 Tax=Caenorhabditis auriculariae TaxID=2777116 RepID=A0A8S1HMN6_9PELO|nr:unnamed protein product [Caenorhabditis auriculariae]
MNVIRTMKSTRLTNGLNMRPAFFNDSPIVLKLIQDNFSRDPHYKSVGCTISELGPIANRKLQKALQQPYSLIIEDSDGHPSGFVLASKTHRYRERRREASEVDKDNGVNYVYLDRLFKFCRLHFWVNVHDRYEKVAVLKSIVLLGKQDLAVYTSIIAATIKRIRESDETIEGVMCVATDEMTLKTLKEAGFQVLFSCPPEMYVKDCGEIWQPQSNLRSAHVAWIPFEDVVARKKRGTK